MAQRALASAEELEATLEASAKDSYAAAQAALLKENDAAAREHLVQRQQTNARLTSAKLQTLEAAERLRKMRNAVEALSERAAQVEALMSRAVVGATGSAAGEPSAAELEDPLERKFRELE